MQPKLVPLAPRWHTAALLVLLLAVGITGPLLSSAEATAAVGSVSLISVYLPLIAAQIALFVYVVRVGQAGSALGTLLGPPPSSLGRALRDVALAAATFFVIVGLESWLELEARAGRTVAVERLLPTHPLGVIAFTACLVAFCEEVVYRGYLQRQLAALTRNRPFAFVLQAALFGLAHGEQGAPAALRVGLYGLILGGLALRAGSLYPAILCHAAIDLVAGLAAR